MGQLTVRNVDDEVIQALKKRAADHGRSAEAEHREILRKSLFEKEKYGKSVAARAAALRKRLKSSVESADLIREDRDRDSL